MPSERILRQIKARLSLRKPQADSLDILADIVEQSPLDDLVPFEKTVDPAAMLDAVHARYPGVSDFERDFASLCFALATGCRENPPYGRVYQLPLPIGPLEAFLCARAEHHHLRQANCRLQTQHREICLQGRRRICSDATNF